MHGATGATIRAPQPARLLQSGGWRGAGIQEPPSGPRVPADRAGRGLEGVFRAAFRSLNNKCFGGRLSQAVLSCIALLRGNEVN